MAPSRGYRTAAIGSSAGGMSALSRILSGLPEDLPLAVIVAQHQHPDSDDFLPLHLDDKCLMRVKEADEKEPIAAGTVYFAPPDYHLLIETNETFSLSTAERVNHSRPSIDVLFESAAGVFESALIGVVLTGANADGAEGMRAVKQCGGTTVVQDPETAECDIMPRAAIAACTIDHILPLEGIGRFLADPTDRKDRI